MGEHYDPELTAFDFAFALKRAADPSTESPFIPQFQIYTTHPKSIRAG